MQFHERLKEYRKKQGLTQKELAEKLHVSRSAVAKWENGLGLPSDDSLDEISALFAVKRQDLLSDRETETIIVEKNGQLFKQKKWLTGLVAASVALVIFATVLLAVFLTQGKEEVRLGAGDPVMTGVIGYFNANSETLNGNERLEVYHLKSGETYEFRVRPIYRGSRSMMLGKGGVNIYYDNKLFTFDEGEYRKAGVYTPADQCPFYFTCLGAAAYTEIFVSAEGFWCKVAVMIDD